MRPVRTSARIAPRRSYGRDFGCGAVRANPTVEGPIS